MLLFKTYKIILLSGVGVSLLPSFAMAQTSAIPKISPQISAEVVHEIQNEYTTDADDPSIEGYNNLFYRSEVAPTLQFNENFYLDGVAVFETIQDRDLNKSNFFDNEGVFIEEIKLNYEHGAWSAFAGKFNPAFGIAWDYRGIWGEDFAEDYEITERIGFGGGYVFDTPQYGAHALTASTFFADTSFLSQSKITDRGDLSKSDGGASNTESFESFAVSLDGENLGGVDGLYYKIGYQNQAEGDADIEADRQTGVALTMGHAMPLTDRVALDGLVEYAIINNVDSADVDSDYITASLITTMDDAWNVTASYTGRDIEAAGAADDDDYLFQISGGYDFGQGTTAEIGYRTAEESGNDTNIIGGLVRHIVEF
jgi:hypothetical protein